MPVDRPTFSESWYRVAELRPRLISTVQIHRQHFRGRTWHVVADPASNQFFRLNEAAYRFVAMLDGRRTVAEVWKICNDQLGDDAPTQPEAIQLLGQLYTSNLLTAELPPDAEGLFNRYHKRITREIQSYLMNVMFLRIPLIDPDHFLDRWIGVVGWLFSWFGGLLWIGLMLAAGFFLIGRFSQLTDQFEQTFEQAKLMSNLPAMYGAMIFIKVLHEFGHAFACKKFGRQTGTGGEVHAMGVMFLIFTPLPYVDASSSWAFRSKWHRMVVGMGGMYVELAVAAIAAIVWAHTAQDTLIRSLSYYMIFIAGVSTVLFNANPLLRYDGYYILSDALEMPNLWQRSRQYVYYLVKRYAWGVRRPFNPANSGGERIWLTIYGIASTIYRFVICLGILYFIADRLFLLGAVLACVAIVVWVFVPIGKFLHYLFTSGELMRVRGRAMATTLVTIGAIFFGLGFINAADHCRAEGVIEPIDMQFVHAQADGFISRQAADFVESGRIVRAGQRLLVSSNPDLEAMRKQLLADRDRYEAERRQALDQGVPSLARVNEEHLAAVAHNLSLVDDRLAKLKPAAPLAGEWICPQIEQLYGAYVQEGQRLGLVADPTRLMIRAIVTQNDAWMIEHVDREVEFRILGRPDLHKIGQSFKGRIESILPAGQSQLPSAALGYAAGGEIPISPSDREGRKTTERVFEVHIIPAPDTPVRLLSGQRVVVRFTTPPKPLATQWWRAAMQMVQKRFRV
ncbi:MAG: PqqD family peptide modification chaperone [Phycisphaerae bacterium]|nr:PqqD family peptide modification chaperone [Phycisphaerae bacterium]